MDDYTIVETFTLPSKGKIYSPQIAPEITLRSMTTFEEMMRLSQTERDNKRMCDLIDACTVSDKQISSYDMHLGDYQFLMHRLRTLTYGSEYPCRSRCPMCGKVMSYTMNLDELDIQAYDEEYSGLFNVVLPATGKKVVMSFETPRIVDNVLRDKKEFEEANPDSVLEVEVLYHLKYCIRSIDGKATDPQSLELWLRKLPAKDYMCLMHRLTKLNEGIGLITTTEIKCDNPKCGAVYPRSFRYNSDFWEPDTDK